MTNGAAQLEFLGDETRVVESPSRLLERIAKRLSGPGPADEVVFGSANLMALALVRLRRRDDAEALCRAEVAAAVAASRADRAYLLHALEAQVNLFRILGMHGDAAAAVRGLALLEDVADCRAVAFPEFDWPAMPTAVTPEAIRPRLYARNVLVTDTCKILLKAGLHDELVAAASHYLARWPVSIREGLHASAEVAPMLGVHDDAKLCVPMSEAPSVEQTRLALISDLHAARSGEPISAGDADGLAARIRATAGPFLSPGTPLRWELHLLVTTTRDRAAGAVAAQARNLYLRARALGDDALAGQTARHFAGLDGVEPPSGEPSRSAADALADRVLDAVQRFPALGGLAGSA